ncbi:BPTD_3080 family restriction endonuclease [Iamia sp.]|uniref:BPTD_3080 family restriction endonuclease n=1 Tax=Iamia sp. TaxID=2722710 RepID=UPI0039C8B107
MNRRIDNPILNSPFVGPTRHFRFDDDGITDEVVEGRRRSVYLTPIPPVRKGAGPGPARARGAAPEVQGELVYEGEAAERIVENSFINEVRARVDLWRQRGYPNITSTTRRLLEHWTAEGREKRFFFCQVEALETAIFLAEAAHKETGGSYLQESLRDVADEHNPGLYRVALKMATGTGKTVVMAMLIAWQTLNKAANPQDGRFTDAFLVVCPGLTIRDRLRVLEPSEPDNYYDERNVVPPELRTRMSRATVVITNFHTFRAKEKIKAARTTKNLLTRGRTDTAGVFTETPAQVVLRVCRAFRSKRSIVVLNDEAHHCYKPKAPVADVLAGATDATGVKLDAEAKAEAKERDAEARVWVDGLSAVHAKLGVKTAYDLSATPFFLSGSGRPEGKLFPWVVSDFGLVDAIEAGLVKIPRVPVADNAAPHSTRDHAPTYRNLWVRIRDELPKRRPLKELDTPTEPQPPPELEGAMRSLYGDYEAAYRRWEQAGTTPTPPVFIVVCNNTTTSKMVFDWIAGWPKPLPAAGSETDAGDDHGDATVVVPQRGRLPLFSNVEGDRFLTRPRTILVDSRELERGEGLSPEFKAAAATEIAELKAEVARRSGAGAAEELTDEEILREVMNTIGKPGRLGEGVRCVVSVSMLTEGWDANTVTHILGVRAFGTQLLAEQVVGRGLRRRSYAVVDTDEGERFAPEYAEIYGIPFSFIPAGGVGAEPPEAKPVTRVWAPPERSHLAIRFPHVVGYRRELDVDDRLTAAFDETSRLTLSSADVPTSIEVEGIVGERRIHTLDDLQALRPQEVAFHIAHRLLETHFGGGAGTQARPWLFPRLVSLVKAWIAHPDGLRLNDNAFVGLLTLTVNQARVVDKVWAGINRVAGETHRLLPVLADGDPWGTTDGVDFETTKACRPTAPDRSPVTQVVEDSGWEGGVAQRIEEMDEVLRYVKNQNLGLDIPYRTNGRSHRYWPDFVVCVADPRSTGPDDLLHVLVEVSGQRDEAKVDKCATARDFWVPAVNAHGGFGRWAFAEVTDPFDVHHTVRAVAATGPAAPPADPDVAEAAG